MARKREKDRGKNSRAHQHYKRLQRKAREYSADGYRVCDVVHTLGVLTTPKFAKYWAKKQRDPTFKRGVWFSMSACFGYFLLILDWFHVRLPRGGSQLQVR